MSALIPGRHYALVRPDSSPDRARVSVIQVHDAGTYSSIWTAVTTPEAAAQAIAAAGWEQDGEPMAAPMGEFVPLRRTRPGQPPRGPRKTVSLRLPLDLHADLVAAAAAAGRSLTDEIIIRCARQEPATERTNLA